MSTPITFPFFPTFLDAKKTSIPPPEPKSKTVSPFLKLANATGFPQPKPKIADSGKSSKSCSE